MGKLFGTDGVRGVANKELTVELATRLGQAGAYVLTEKNHRRATILVGCDTRKSGDMLAMALMAGVNSVGANAVYLGVVPTPAVAYLTKKYNADAGVVISASHNPAEYNGIKFFSGDGYKLPDEMEDRIEEIIFADNRDIHFPIGGSIGRLEYRFDAKEDYIDYMCSLLDLDLNGLKIVVDCANGASSYTSPQALKRLGADVVVIHSEPDGININRDCGSTHMEALMARVVEENADVGLAFDGDADRLLAVDEKGCVVDGDQLMAICGMYLKEKGKLKKDTIVVTVMSNLGLHLMADKEFIHLEETRVGDRYVLENMLENGYVIGGEQSGHIIFLEENTTGDGLLSALHLLQVMKEKKVPLSELASVMTVLPQVLVNARVPNENKYVYMDNDDIRNAVRDLETKFDGQGRVLIRPSGTEPLVRVMIEGKDRAVLQAEAEKLAKLIEEKLV